MPQVKMTATIDSGGNHYEKGEIHTFYPRKAARLVGLGFAKYVLQNTTTVVKNKTPSRQKRGGDDGNGDIHSKELLP